MCLFYLPNHPESSLRVGFGGWIFWVFHLLLRSRGYTTGAQLYLGDRLINICFPQDLGFPKPFIASFLPQLLLSPALWQPVSNKHMRKWENIELGARRTTASWTTYCISTSWQCLTCIVSNLSFITTLQIGNCTPILHMRTDTLLEGAEVTELKTKFCLFPSFATYKSCKLGPIA